ncbi:MAG: hypothetical protein LBV28_03385 [Puniceicoccales bacterium]|jgi:hypothetical protein|nr:hypothetical protein [Puniceicoccales bacterium]
MDTLAFLSGVTEWWNNLDTAAQIFNGIGLLAGAVTLLLLVFTILGLDHGGLSDALEVDIASDIDVHADGSFFSTRSIAGFFLGFGGGGAVTYAHTANALLAGAVGLGVGVVMLYSIYFIGKRLLKLQSDGTVDFKQAIGSTGTVYITIPPKRGSGGQAQIVFNNRHEVVQAISDADAALPAGVNIRVKEHVSGSLFLVETL